MSVESLLGLSYALCERMVLCNTVQYHLADASTLHSQSATIRESLRNGGHGGDQPLAVTTSLLSGDRKLEEAKSL